VTATGPGWLELQEGAAPLIVAFPHTGFDLPEEFSSGLVSPWLARRDADWWIEQLYDFAGDLGATTLRTRVSRSVIDVNRDPSGASLYPGQATTGLCPTTSFDGEPLYREGCEPDETDIARRRAQYFTPYHEALVLQIARLRAEHARVVVYDAHSIRSRIPRLFEGELPQFNIGTNDGRACDGRLAARVAELCAASGRSWVLDGRFKGGWTTRRHGAPAEGVHAIQMELACRGYMAEPFEQPAPETWPTAHDSLRAAPIRAVLTEILRACLAFAVGPEASRPGARR
jgi:N-formylglutamate deformylase